MENKTIPYLNSKVWFRLVRVVYIVVFAVILAGYNSIIFSDGVKKLDYDKTIITCEKGKNLSLRQIGLSFDTLEGFSNNTFDNYTYENFIKDHINLAEDIASECNKQSDGFRPLFSADQLQNPQSYSGSDLTKGAPLSFQDKIKPVDNSNGFDPSKLGYYPIIDLAKYRFFNIAPRYSYTKFIEYFIIGNLIIVFAFFLVRGTFYYIVLGNFRPQK